MGASGLGWKDGDGFDKEELSHAKRARKPGCAPRPTLIEERLVEEINLNVVSKRVLGLPDPK